jgi:putative multiple sugar transport system permease protein
MFIALFVIMGVFTATTDGIFISPRNISNLLNQTGYIAVLAVGMTLVIVIRQIDLSVGFLAGFLGAIAAIALAFWHLPVYLVIPFVLFEIVAGCITAFRLRIGIPLFCLAGGWLIYRGAILDALKAGHHYSDAAVIGNGYSRPPVWFLPASHKLLLLAQRLFYVLGEISTRKNKMAYNFEVCHRACSY